MASGISAFLLLVFMIWYLEIQPSANFLLYKVHAASQCKNGPRETLPCWGNEQYMRHTVFFKMPLNYLKLFVKERHSPRMHFGRRETPLDARTLLRGAQQTKPLIFTT
jgi:hypothetical protein